MEHRNHVRRRGFTLVEMLVVIGIIVLLMALLVPAAAISVSKVRDFNMSAEIGQLATAIETYKKEKGDYPPSMGEIDASGNSLYLPATRYNTVVERHLRKCYPKISQTERDFFYNYIALDSNGQNRLTADEALVFWLSLTQNDERNPFSGKSQNFKQYYDFKAERLFVFDNDVVTWTDADGTARQLTLPSYKPTYAGDTAFVYLDARTYAMHRQAQYALGGTVQAYFNDLPGTLATQNSYMNSTTFQILCAGQDKEFGQAKNQFDNNNNIQEPKRFKSGINYTDDDKDNLTNFSEGRRLGSHMP
jgi:prepilin-type N-terminal cleavage/methylation domain-containing protein